MKLLHLFSITLLSFGTIAIAQNRKITKTGEVTFEASVPAFEEVKATNKAVSCVLNTKTGEIAALALMKGFRFKVALMEEHFNEKYAESDTYPKATFKGIIKNFDINKLDKSDTKYALSGTLTIHGKSKEISTTAILTKKGNDIELTSDFIVSPADFDIEIPKIVVNKIAKTVNVNSVFLLK